MNPLHFPMVLSTRNPEIYYRGRKLAPAPDAVINDYLNQAYLDLATAHDWPWTETTAIFNFEDEVAAYALPADLNRLRAVIYTGQGAEAQPRRTSKEAVLRRYGGSVPDSSLPDEFYRQGLEIVFAPTPNDDTQEVQLLYYKRPEPLVNDVDAPLFDPAFHVYLSQAASALYFESEESYDYASFYHAKAADTFIRMAEFYDLQMPPEQPFIIGAGDHHGAVSTG